MRIIGVDPGLANSGIGIVEQDGGGITLVGSKCITTQPSTSFPERLMSIYGELEDALDEYQPEACAIESIFFAKNAKSAFQVGHARGVFILSAGIRGIPVFEYTPPQIKKALVGKGRADKSQVQYMTKMILNLPEIPKPDHVADALAAAICHLNSIKFMSLTGSEQLVYKRKRKR